MAPDTLYRALSTRDVPGAGPVTRAYPSRTCASCKSWPRATRDKARFCELRMVATRASDSCGRWEADPCSD